MTAAGVRLTCELIASEGYDPTYGARPLKRVIQQRIQNPLATSLLKGEVSDGQTIRIIDDGGDLAIEADEAEQSEAEGQASAG